MRNRELCWSALFLLAGCGPNIYSYRVRVNTNRETIVTTISRIFAESGVEIARADPSTGTVETLWQDTRYLYGQVEGTSARLVRRYVCTVTNRSPNLELSLRADERRCAATAYTVINGEVQGRCEAEPDIPQPHRNELDAIGERLRAALGTSAVRVQ